MSNKKNIEQLFKEQLENFEVEPQGDLWTNIKSEISNPVSSFEPVSSSSKLSAVTSSSWMSTLIVSAVISGVIIGSYFYFDNKTQQNKIPTSEIKVSQELKQNTIEDIVTEKDTLTNKLNTTIQNNKIEAKKEVPTENLAIESNSISEIQEKINQEEDLNTPSFNSSDIKKTPSSDQSELNKVNYDLNENETSETNSISDNSSSDSPSEVTKSTDPEFKEDNLSTNIEEIEEESAEAIKEEQIKKELLAFQLPNIFTPNQDGANDFFEINAKEIGLDGIEVSIFDRTGNLIRNWMTLYEKWDGNLSDGSPAPKGIYLYQINLKKDGVQVQRKGIFTLNR